MVLPIGGFMPIPLAMMIPFMAVQSIIMGDSFGKGYQFGKRRISSMNNDDFNKLTIVDLISEMQTEFKQAIPKIQQSIDDSTQLQNKIISEMLQILPKFVTQGAQNISESGNLPQQALATLLGPIGQNLLPTSYAETLLPTTDIEATFSLEQLSVEHTKILKGTSKLSLEKQKRIKFYYGLALQKKRQTGDILLSTPTPVGPDVSIPATAQQQTVNSWSNQKFQLLRAYLDAKNAVGIQHNLKMKRNAQGHLPNYTTVVTQVKQQFPQLVSRQRTAIKKYYDFLRLSQNSTNHNITLLAKKAATQRYASPYN